MRLLTIDKIISSIMKETEGLDAEITDGIILSKKEIPQSEIEKAKFELGIEYLDSIFSEYILSYNWGNFGFLSYQFGYGDEMSLSWLINRNLDYDEYSVLSKNNLIIIVNGDPYTILLECKSGEIYAFTSDMSYEEIVPVASDFEEFVRAMGTAQYAVWKNTEKEFIKSMEREYSESSLKFWKELVSVY
ncbi:SMI1/KNR4 family protein [Mogibacterium neglectum]|uniref:SMI1/KNR4 family protein n=1 Tax=Mogibacterium neglectum TaxID=114528 RepID=UPI00272C1CB7|nr:SMI1/KNR4 family protein [Mogibacterium neglectum]WLD76421.1 SMI1/KNR4 family protein [Mogibacterium neglectum]